MGIFAGGRQAGVPHGRLYQMDWRTGVQGVLSLRRSYISANAPRVAASLSD